jgi:DinB family protein
MAGRTRQDALDTLEDGQRRLDALFARLSDERFVRRGAIRAGDWSAKDLMGHVAFWEEIALATIDTWRKGEALRFDQAYVPGGTDALNAWNEHRKAKWSAARVRRESAATHRRLIEEIEFLTAAEWASVIPSPTTRRTRLGTRLGSVLGATKHPFGHAFAHVPDLQASVRSRKRS